MVMETTTSESRSKQLIEMGGNHWQQHGHNRIYISDDMKMAAIGLEISFYKTGNIAGAYLDGKKISNTQARKIYNNLIDSKVFWDIANDQWVGDEMISAAIDRSIK